MCFSPTASFVTAGLTAAIGIVSMTRVTRPRELMLAATPILFGVQQAVEGLLWLVLPTTPDGPAVAGLTLAFMIFAQVLWPIYAPLAVLTIETDRTRRRLILPCLAIGAAVAAYLLWGLLTRPNTAQLMDGHIVYGTTPAQPHSLIIGLAYLAATGLPLMLSSRRTILALGVIILIGSATAYSFYWHAFQSVWCYFAAAASVVLLFHFQWARTSRPQLVRA